MSGGSLFLLSEKIFRALDYSFMFKAYHHAFLLFLRMVDLYNPKTVLKGM
jgi:hypothetical protein